VPGVYFWNPKALLDTTGAEPKLIDIAAGSRQAEIQSLKYQIFKYSSLLSPYQREYASHPYLFHAGFE
jgi:hypothetical protein